MYVNYVLWFTVRVCVLYQNMADMW
jgi:hypothetical protein